MTASPPDPGRSSAVPAPRAPVRQQAPAEAAISNEIDAVCDRFERAWRDGARPRIEDYLGDVSPADRAGLLRELVALDIDYRRQAGEEIDVRQFPERFGLRCEVAPFVPCDSVQPGLGSEPPPPGRETPPACGGGDDRAATISAGLGEASGVEAGSVDLQLLHGVLALRAGDIDFAEFTEALAAWRERPDRPLLDFLHERGQISEADKQRLESLGRQELSLHEGNVWNTVSALADADVLQVCQEIGDPLSRETLIRLPPTQSLVHIEPLNLARQPRSRYSVTRLHGKGGIACVWLAYDQQLKREVALKALRAESENDSLARRRFAREAQITGQLNHPNIVPVFDLAVGAEDDRPFYTMRFLRGRTLSQAIRDYHRRERTGTAARTELADLLAAFVTVCKAVAYAHSRGIVHRDLKPGNIMVGPFGEVILLDWGLAKQTGESTDEHERPIEVSPEGSQATRWGEVMGTPAFMAPEQAVGRHDLEDYRTDIYSLGGVLFAILTGETPHVGKDTREILELIQREPTPDPRTLDPTVPAALAAVCRKAMARNRSDRYDDALQLAADVQRWLADEPLSVFPESVSLKLARWMRRHRKGAQAAGAAVLAIALVSAVSAVVVNQARRSELAAHQRTQEALAAEATAKQQAVQRLHAALDAIDKSLTGVSEVLRDFPGTQALRARLLEQAARDLQQFADQHSQDPGLQAEAGRACIRLGDVYALLERWPQAEAVYDRAVQSFDALRGRETDAVEFPLSAANARTHLAAAHSAQGRHDAAIRHIDAALSILDAASPQDDSQRARTAYLRGVALVNRSAALERLGRFAAAGEDLRRAEHLLTPLAGVDSPAAEHLHALATVRRNLAPVLEALGDVDGAVRSLQQAVGTFQRLTRKDPDQPVYVDGLAASFVYLANLLRTSGREELEIGTYQAALAEYEALEQLRPDVPRYRENLALTQLDFAQVLHDLGRNHEARGLLEPALEMFLELHDRTRDEVQRRHRQEIAAAAATLADVHADLNEDEAAESRYDQALAAYAALLEDQPELPEHQHRAAICLSHLGRLMHKLQRADEAQARFKDALAGFEALSSAGYESDDVKNARAHCHADYADFLWDAGRTAEARAHYTAALKIREALPERAEYVRQRVWLLANCPDLELRDPAAAVRLAEGLTRRLPENARYWSLLGLAHCRDGNSRAAIAAATAAQRLRTTPCGSDDCVLALACLALGEEAAAAKHFAAAESRLMASQPGRATMLRLLREVRTGVSDPAK